MIQLPSIYIPAYVSDYIVCVVDIACTQVCAILKEWSKNQDTIWGKLMYKSIQISLFQYTCYIIIFQSAS